MDVKEVVVKFDPEYGYPGAALVFTFTNLSFVFWANLMGFFGEGAGLAIGVIQLGVFVGYMCGAMALLKKGLTFEGNTFMIFASFFGGVGGLSNTIGPICHHFGIPFADSVAGICWLLCGIILLAVIPSVKSNPKAGFLFYIFGGIGLVFMGLMTLGFIGGAVWAKIIAWCLFAAGTCGLLVTISTMNSVCGNENMPPLGKSFFEQ